MTIWAFDGIGAFFVGEGVDASVADDGTGLSVGTKNESFWALAEVSTWGVDTFVFASTVESIQAFVDFCAVVSIGRQVVSGIAGAHVSGFTFDSVNTGDVGAGVSTSEHWVVARVWDARVFVAVQNESFGALAQV